MYAIAAFLRFYIMMSEAKYIKVHSNLDTYNTYTTYLPTYIFVIFFNTLFFSSKHF